MRKSLLAVAVSCLSMLSCTAKADSFNFSATALGSSTSGVLTAINNNDGSYIVTGISGTGILGLVGAVDPFFGNDNLLFPGNSRLVDVNGLAFTENIAGQIYSLDIFSTISGFRFLALNGNNPPISDSATLSISSPAAVTPEPSSLILLVTGLLGTGTATLRRRLS